MKNRCLEFFLFCIFGFAISSCSQTSGVLEQAVADYLKSLVPAYLQIKNVIIERLSPSETSQGFNFKIAAMPAEPLYAPALFQDVQNELISKGLKPTSNGQTFVGGAQYDFKGLEQLQYIKQVNAPSDAINIYGFVTARKIVDKIEYSGLSFSSGFEGLGKPKGSFLAGTLTVGSAEYKTRLDALIELQEREAATQKAAERQKQVALEKRKAELIEATKPGTRYRGTWTLNASSKIIELEFTNQQMDGRILNATFTLPEDRTQVIEYEGLIDFQAVESNQPPIKLHFVRGNAKATDWGAGLFAGPAQSLFHQQANYDFDLVNGKLIHHYQYADYLQIDLARTPIADAGAKDGSSQSAMDTIKARSKEIALRLQDPGTSEAEKVTLRQDAGILADRLDAIIKAKKGAK
jgi:hypothetical protein